MAQHDVGAYGLIGARAHWGNPQINLDAASYLGLGVRQADGRWGALAVTASRDHSIGNLRGDLALELFGLHYADPFRYTAVSASGRPTLTYRSGNFEWAAAGELSLGRWKARSPSPALVPESPAVEPVEPTTAVRSGPLRVAAFRSSLAAAISRGSITLGGVLANARHGGGSGLYRGASLSVLQVRDRWDFLVEGQLLSGPRETEAGFSVRAGRFLEDRVYVSAEFGRRVTDYTLGTSGHTGATVGVSWQPGMTRPVIRTRPLIVRVGSRDESGTQVMFRLPKTAASSIALVGSFTEWQPKLMDRTEDGWSLTLTLSEGAHQFAFLLDGQRWYLPEGAPGIIDDGFGRRNATVIISAM
jgi:hypothetical protein